MPTQKTWPVQLGVNYFNIEILPSPSHSIDLTPTDVFLFPKLKDIQLEVNHFGIDKEVILSCDNWFSLNN